MLGTYLQITLCQTWISQLANKEVKRILTKYTQEEKIVMAVWYHEKSYSGLTGQQLLDNFRVRFNKKPPKYYSIAQWERRLFYNNSIKRNNMTNRMKSRYMQVPYVKESFRTHPHLTMLQRAHLTGICTAALYQMIKEDITKEEIEKLKKEGQKVASVENQEKEERENTANKIALCSLTGAAFHLRPDFLKPFPQGNLSKEKKTYNNYRLSRARRIIENVFGIMAARFQILHTNINMSLDRIDLVVLTCAVLHNFLRRKCSDSYTAGESLDTENWESSTIKCWATNEPRYCFWIT
nr:unnamed protein product [Callosobruchus chinensis]